MRPPALVGPRGTVVATVAVVVVVSVLALLVVGGFAGPDRQGVSGTEGAAAPETDAAEFGADSDTDCHVTYRLGLATGETGNGQTLLLTLVGIVIVGLALAVAAVGWRRHREREAGSDGSRAATDDSRDPGDRADDETGETDTDSRDAGDTDRDGTEECDTGSGGAGDTSGDGVIAGQGRETPPPELLSSEERVLRLLGQNGGRMRQQAVAERLDWTAAKTSQVVSDLREEGAIESFRIGRENVLTLPDVGIMDPTDDEDDPAG